MQKMISGSRNQDPGAGKRAGAGQSQIYRDLRI